MTNLRFVLRSGALIPLLVMLPNLAWMLTAKGAPAVKTSEPLWLTIAENAGRAAILVIPFFYSLDLNKRFSLPALVVMGLALALYHAAWVRFFAGGREPALLSAPLLGIPLPLAVAPVVFLIMSAYLMGSWPMLAASLLFGAAHLWVSALTL